MAALGANPEIAAPIQGVQHLVDLHWILRGIPPQGAAGAANLYFLFGKKYKKKQERDKWDFGVVEKNKK